MTVPAMINSPCGVRETSQAIANLDVTYVVDDQHDSEGHLSVVRAGAVVQHGPRGVGHVVHCARSESRGPDRQHNLAYCQHRERPNPFLSTYNLSGHHDCDESEHDDVGQFEHFQLFISENAPNSPSLRQQISATK